MFLFYQVYAEKKTVCSRQPFDQQFQKELKHTSIIYLCKTNILVATTNEAQLIVVSFDFLDIWQTFRFSHRVKFQRFKEQHVFNFIIFRLKCLKRKWKWVFVELIQFCLVLFPSRISYYAFSLLRHDLTHLSASIW